MSEPTGPLRILRNYFFWTYERGSFHYDVMVTLILVFLFVSPHLIDFHDRPIPTVPARSSQVLVLNTGAVQDGARRFVYEIRADDVGNASSDDARRARIAQIVANIAGPAQLETVKPVKDPHGRIVAYDAVVIR